MMILRRLQLDTSKDKKSRLLKLLIITLISCIIFSNIPIGKAYAARSHSYAARSHSGTSNAQTLPATPADIASENNASSSAYAYLNAEQQAAQAWSVPTQTQLIGSAINATTIGVIGNGTVDGAVYGAVYDAVYGATTIGVIGNGTVDDTSSIQEVVNDAPSGGAIFFPAGDYVIRGAIDITKPLTLVGESGTVFDCSGVGPNVEGTYAIGINAQGTGNVYAGNVTITGIEFDGPGIETWPVMIEAKYDNNIEVSYCKFKNVGYAAIQLYDSNNTTVDSCVFDNVFMTGEGYGVEIIDNCTNTIVENSFFLTLGRHGITADRYTIPPQSQWVKLITVRNNYFENTTEEAINAHEATTGPYDIYNNVFYNCAKGVLLREGAADIENNNFIKCKEGVNLLGDPATHTVSNNTFLYTYWEAIDLETPNVQVSNNFSFGTGIPGNGSGEISVDSSGDVIQNNYFNNVSQPIELGDNAGQNTIEDNIV